MLRSLRILLRSLRILFRSLRILFRSLAIALAPSRPYSRDMFAEMFHSSVDNDFRSTDDVHTTLRGVEALALQVVDRGKR